VAVLMATSHVMAADLASGTSQTTLFWGEAKITIAMQPGGSLLSLNMTPSAYVQTGYAGVLGRNGGFGNYDAAAFDTASQIAGVKQGVQYLSTAQSSSNVIRSQTALSTSEQGSFESTASARTENVLLFKGVGMGHVTVSVPYEITSSASSGQGGSSQTIGTLYMLAYQMSALGSITTKVGATQLSNGMQSLDGVDKTTDRLPSGVLNLEFDVTPGAYAVIGLANSISVATVTVPEPGTSALMLLGGVALFGLRKRAAAHAAA
jgi:hypothetical protein